jgi:hypothetical protein
MFTAIILLALAIRAIVHSITPGFAEHAGVRLAGAGIAALGLFCGAFLLFTGQAVAAETVTADLRPIWGYGVEIIGGALTALGGFGVRSLTRFLRLKEDGLIRSYLDDALHRALAWAVESAVRKGDDLARVEVRSRLVAEAAGYAAEAVPDALKRFGVSENGLRQRLEARLGEWAPHPDQPAVFGRVSDAG